MSKAISKHDRFFGLGFRHLAAFEAVADHRSFHAAARALGYSQSAVSQQIASLERVAGARLLDRPVGTRHVALTDAGERVLRHTRRAVAAIRAAEADLRALAEGEAGTVRVGTFQSASTRLVPRAMHDFIERRPGIEVRLVEAAYDDELAAFLRAGEVELSFLFESDEPAFASIPVLTDPYVLITPAGSPASTTTRPLRPAEIAKLPLIGYGRPEASGESFLVRRGLEVEVVFRSDEMGAVQGMVGAGVGHALVPLLTVRPGDPHIAVVEVTGVPSREIVLAWHADRTLSLGAEAFIEVVAEVGRSWVSTTVEPQ